VPEILTNEKVSVRLAVFDEYHEMIL